MAFALISIYLYICITLGFMQTSAADNPCGFTLHPDPTFWQTAKASCADEGMQMVTIETESKQQFVTDWLAGIQEELLMEQLWVGAKHDENGTCMWSTGHVCTYQNWQNDLPKEACVAVWRSAINRGQWGSTFCSNFLPYICEPLVDSCVPLLTTGELAAVVVCSLLLVVAIVVISYVVYKKIIVPRLGKYGVSSDECTFITAKPITSEGEQEDSKDVEANGNVSDSTEKVHIKLAGDVEPDVKDSNEKVEKA